jgi:hypothetical protein
MDDQLLRSRGEQNSTTSVRPKRSIPRLAPNPLLNGLIVDQSGDAFGSVDLPEPTVPGCPADTRRVVA